MPEVTLIDYTGKGHPDPLYAAKLLAFTKNTRLSFTPGAFDAFMEKDEEEIQKEMDYMASTIPSSWEFCHATFLITKVSRATAQQITRTRTASFAMASQRVTDMSNATWDKMGEEPAERDMHDIRMEAAINSYKGALAAGMSLEDARDLLPIGLHCQLVASYNLRSLVDLCIARESIRVQGPYREVVRQMKEEIFTVWPWVGTFFQNKKDKASILLQEVAEELAGKGAVYKGAAGKVAKALDLIKKG